MKLYKFIFAMLFLSFIFTVCVLAQTDNPTAGDKLQDFILSMIVDGGPAFLVSAWIAKQWTKAKNFPMVLQTWLVAIVLTFLAALVGIIQIPISEVWTWLLSGLTNGLLANLIYKSGILNSLLVMFKIDKVSIANSK